MTTHTPCTILKQLQDLPGNARICLYGSGAYARRLLELFPLIRPDLLVPFLVDNFKDGRKYDMEIVHIETLPSRQKRV